MTILLAAMIAAATTVSFAQAPQGQPPADGRGRGGGQGRGGGAGRGDGQAPPRGDGQGRGGDARGGQGRGAAAPPPPQAIKMVKPGVYMVINGGGNSTVRVTDQGVILVDTKNLGDQPYNDLVAQIKTVTQQPVKYAIITHVHQDHAGNIERFEKAGVPVIAYSGLNQNLHVGGPNGKGYEAAQGKPADANMPYNKKNKKVKVGKAEAIAYHFAAGHTSGDTVVYFKDAKVVSLGDEFTATPPNCDYPMGGSILTWSKSLAEVLKLDFDTAIPGHGNDPMTKADVATFQKRIDAIGKKAVELVKAGTTKEQLRAQIQMSLGADMGNWQMNNVIADARLDAFYQDISNAAKNAKGGKKAD
jgi:glyoxylase-like metal-dependent hydrolase (beta-lactamase superfamily II)